MSKTQQELADLLREDNYQVKMFAKNSRFYRQIMEDGNVFNPYVHRRFLPAHYLQLAKIKDYVPSNMLTNLQWHLTGSYLNRMVVKELSTLAYLNKVDLWAFEERSLIFSIEQYKQIFKLAIDYVYYSNETRQNLCNKLNNVQTHQEVLDFYVSHLRIRSWFWGANNIKKPFIEGFYLRAGAYYTLKHEIMFCDNQLVPGKDTVERCEFILQKLKEGKDWIYFHEMLKK